MNSRRIIRAVSTARTSIAPNMNHNTIAIATATPTLKIAFGSHARCGKDTSAEYLQSRHGGEILRFADPLKEIMAYAQSKCNFKQTKDTKFLQMVGTDWARNIDDDVWVNLLIKRADACVGHVFVSDLRFRNEAAALSRAGFILIDVRRDNRVIDRDPTHQSENDLNDFDGWDYVIDNNGSLELLYSKLDNIISPHSL